MAAPDSVALSTGETVSLPFEAVCSFVGVAVAADAARVARSLPPGLVAPRVAPGRAPVALLGVEYADVGPLAPYAEFGVVLPAVRAPARPVADWLCRPFGGFVHSLVVTTRSGVALGRDVWGYPKRLGRVELDAAGGLVTVRAGGDPGLVLSCERGGARRRRHTLDSYVADGDGAARVPVALDGRYTLRPGGRARLSLGGGDARSARERDRTDRAPDDLLGSLAALGVRERPLARWYGTDVALTFRSTPESF